MIDRYCIQKSQKVTEKQIAVLSTIFKNNKNLNFWHTSKMGMFVSSALKIIRQQKCHMKIIVNVYGFFRFINGLYLSTSTDHYSLVSFRLYRALRIILFVFFSNKIKKSQLNLNSSNNHFKRLTCLIQKINESLEANFTDIENENKQLIYRFLFLFFFR